jgi:hypothetical protein
MAIPKKKDNECSQVKVTLCGEIKRKVLEKQEELKNAGLHYSKELAIKKLILGK